MFLIIIGALVIIAGFAVRSVDNAGRYAGSIRLAGVFILAIGIAISCFVQVVRFRIVKPATGLPVVL